MTRRSRAKKPRARKQRAPSRAIWKGSIDFGLVNIPVRLYSAESPGRINFDLLDKRDFSRVRYRRVNEKTGREVPWDEIVKGYEYDKDEYVALSDDDFTQANVEATQTIAITDFVDAADVSPIYYDKPYYLEPLKSGHRAYALLRQVLKKTGKVGISKVVIRTRQHLAMLLADGPRLILNLLRFPHELRDPSGLDLPKNGAKSAAVSTQEIKMAERLVETMVNEWNPEKYHDEYHDDLMKLIEKKIKAGKTKVVETAKPAAKAPERGKVIDIMHLLRQSVKQVDKKDQPSRRKAS
jgi:DNA end-binding protein Ku